jgi:hypothetical protein
MPAITHPFCWWNKRFYFIVLLRQFPASLRQNTIYNQELEIWFCQDILYSIIFPIMNMLQIHGYYRLVLVLLREKFPHHWKMVIWMMTAYSKCSDIDTILSIHVLGKSHMVYIVAGLGDTWTEYDNWWWHIVVLYRLIGFNFHFLDKSIWGKTYLKLIVLIYVPYLRLNPCLVRLTIKGGITVEFAQQIPPIVLTRISENGAFHLLTLGNSIEVIWKMASIS